MHLGRRAFLFALAAFGLVRPARADTVVKAPKKIWDAVEFEFQKGDRAFPGIAVRVPAKADGGSSIYTVCTICPHNGCQFGFQPDYKALGKTIEKDLSHPVLFCPCHQSTYDPTDEGRVINGPAPRPPWRFQAHQSGDDLVITELEKGAGEFD